MCVCITAIVIFTLFQRFVQSGNTEVTVATAIDMVIELVGIGVGSVVLAGLICYSSAYFLKNSDPALKQHPTYEISIILISSYASYVAADLCQLSGLLAVFFSGVFIRHYHMYNISQASAHAFKHLLSTLAFLAENFIYLYLGLSLIAYSDAFLWDWMFIWANFGACLLARALNTFPLCAIANACRSKAQRIPIKYMCVIWFSGLRGAIAFALALNVQTSDPSHAAIIKSSTLFTVLFTTVFFGMGTSPLLSCLELSSSAEAPPEKHAMSISHEAPTEDEEHLLLLPCSPPASTTHYGGTANVHDAWVELDEKYLKPLFGGNPRPRAEPLKGFHHPGYQSMD